ncbi:MAG TPA: ribosome maturation factor RimP [Solirubrobacteraceae bacterium]|jgi:ribosome maturation factor RimP|nr:ribosome maturation factor RimP [Solirubrobacteraceae bacterium]
MSAVQTEIEERLALSEPEVEVLLAEELPNGTLRVFIDHPEGVTLGLCERITGHLADVRERYALEVSSPGARRPLTKPSHFRRYVGRRARVRGRRNYTGELVSAGEKEITLAAPEGIVAIPYSEIRRSNLVEE